MIDQIFRWFGLQRIPKITSRRSYESAKVSRLNWSWLSPNTNQDAEARYALPTLRNRSRELVRNNDYARKFIKMVSTNVIGPAGIKLQAQVKRGEEFDNEVNDSIERSWQEWGDKGTPTTDGKLSWLDLQTLVAESVARDGEVLLRKFPAWDGNKFRFCLQPFEADYLDESKNSNYVGGTNVIRQGIEFDRWGKPIAYYLHKRHPGDYINFRDKSEIERIDANEIIHVFITDRIGQSRGIPWMHTAARRLDQVGEYEEAELVAARVGASQCGFFQKSATTISPVIADAKDAEGNLLFEATPGVFRDLPPGVEFNPFNPTHPTSAYNDFIKATLRGAAAGLLVSYTNLACDLRDVNYSSIRAGLLEERDIWRMIQAWIVSSFHQVIYKEWLKSALLARAIDIPSSMTRYEEFLNVKWQPRGWLWVDPAKDLEASKGEIDAGLNTRSRIIAETIGEDLDSILRQLAEEEKLIKKYGLELKKEDKPNGNQNNPNQE